MTDAFDLQGRSAVVTGGNGGLGLAMAEALAAAGANIAIWGRNEHKSARAVERLESRGVEAIAVPCDVANEDDVESALEATVSALGAVHICVANAGVAGRGTRFTEMTTEEWRNLLEVNLDGFFFTTRALTRHMVEHGDGGSVIGISSLAAIEGQARGQHYAASKGGVVSMIRAIAVEYAKYGIRANAVLPGWIESDMTVEALASEPMKQRVLPRVPAGRWGRPDDLGGLAVYLASDASAYHTGDTLVIDGGYAIF